MFLFCFVFTVLDDLEKKGRKEERGEEEKREGVGCRGK